MLEAIKEVMRKCLTSRKEKKKVRRTGRGTRRTSTRKTRRGINTTRETKQIKRNTIGDSKKIMEIL
jgi:hypothetical protein